MYPKSLKKIASNKNILNQLPPTPSKPGKDNDKLIENMKVALIKFSNQFNPPTATSNYLESPRKRTYSIDPITSIARLTFPFSSANW